MEENRICIAEDGLIVVVARGSGWCVRKRQLRIKPLEHSQTLELIFLIKAQFRELAALERTEDRPRRAQGMGE